MADEPRPTRGRLSRIQQLPADIKARLDELLRSGVSQKAILDQLAPLCESAGEPPISRSGLNRYATRMEAEARLDRAGIEARLERIEGLLEALLEQREK